MNDKPINVIMDGIREHYGRLAYLIFPVLSQTCKVKVKSTNIHLVFLLVWLSSKVMF